MFNFLKGYMSDQHLTLIKYHNDTESYVVTFDSATLWHLIIVDVGLTYSFFSEINHSLILGNKLIARLFFYSLALLSS